MLGTALVSLGVFFLVGLLGGAHCVGMCGPLIALYSDRMNVSSRRPDALTVGELKQHVLFNLGRTVSYMTVGAAFGAAGSLVFVTARDVTVVASDVHAVAGLAVGVAVIAVGFGYVTSGAARSLLPVAVTAKGVVGNPFIHHSTCRRMGGRQTYRRSGCGTRSATVPAPVSGFPLRVRPRLGDRRRSKPRGTRCRHRARSLRHGGYTGFDRHAWKEEATQTPGSGVRGLRLHTPPARSGVARRPASAPADTVLRALVNRTVGTGETPSDRWEPSPARTYFFWCDRLNVGDIAGDIYARRLLQK